LAQKVGATPPFAISYQRQEKTETKQIPVMDNVSDQEQSPSHS
jgi:hypothetical protein